MAATDVLGYLNSKGLSLKQAGANEVHMSCFFCGEDPGARGRLYVNVDPVADIPGLFTCHLCGQSGNLITLKKHFGDSTSQSDLDVNCRYEIFQAAARHFHHNLSDYAEALMYLKGPERGLTIETITSHRLGYAGAEAPVYQALRDQGFSKKDIVATGLCYEKDGRVVECFNDMITIPYMTAGNVITIRGRTWPYDKADKKPKYKTIPGADSRLFNSDFTWHEKEIILVEGEFDAMVLEQLGFPAVGVPGAQGWQDSWDAYVAEVRRIFVVFDRDAAGTRGAAKLEERFGSKVRPIHISPPGQKIDPTDWVAGGHGAEDFQNLIDEANRTGGVLVSVDEAYQEFNTVDETPGLKFGFELLDAALYPGLRPSQLMVVLAKTGCLTGDTEIAVNRAGKGFKITLEDLYTRWTGGRYAWDKSIPSKIQRADDSVVKLGVIDEVWDSGIKPVYEIITDSGRSLKATAKHPFLTPDGWKPLGELHVGDEVNVNVGRSKKGRTEKSHYRIRSGLVRHPFHGRKNVKAGGRSVPLHRLVAEADLNNLPLEKFLEKCRTDASGLTFLDPAVYAVHHKDRDALNNELSNLEVLTHEDHQLRHAGEGTGNNVLEQIDTEVIVSIEFLGDQQTYDISVKDDPHNFLANGFVVHNTGKTLLLLNLMQRMAVQKGQEDTKFLFLSLEQTRSEWFDRARRLHRFYNLNDSDEDAKNFWRSRLLLADKNRLTAEDVKQAIDDFEYRMGTPPDVICLDYLGYWARSFRGDEYQRLSEAIMVLKGLAKDIRIPIIAPHQVNRGVKDGEAFSSDAGRGSGVIEETADFMMSIYSADNHLGRNEEEKNGQLVMEILKSRHGGRGQKLKIQFAPLTLAMVPLEDPLASLARDELTYASLQFRDSWEDALYRHRTGFKGKMKSVSPSMEQGTF